MIQSLFINSVIAIIFAFILFPPAKLRWKKTRWTIGALRGMRRKLIFNASCKLSWVTQRKCCEFSKNFTCLLVEGRLLNKAFFVDSPCAWTFFFNLYVVFGIIGTSLSFQMNYTPLQNRNVNWIDITSKQII